jgi:hypothetical protein
VYALLYGTLPATCQVAAIAAPNTPSIIGHQPMSLLKVEFGSRQRERRPNKSITASAAFCQSQSWLTRIGGHLPNCQRAKHYIVIRPARLCKTRRKNPTRKTALG